MSVDTGENASDDIAGDPLLVSVAMKAAVGHALERDAHITSYCQDGEKHRPTPGHKRHSSSKLPFTSNHEKRQAFEKSSADVQRSLDGIRNVAEAERESAASGGQYSSRRHLYHARTT